MTAVGLDANPQAVAEWIATTAQQQCPAAVNADMRRRNAIIAASASTPEQGPDHER